MEDNISEWNANMILIPAMDSFLKYLYKHYQILLYIN